MASVSCAFLKKKMEMRILWSMMGWDKWDSLCSDCHRNDLRREMTHFYKLWLEHWHLSSIEFSKLSTDVSCCCHMMVPFWHVLALYTCENSVIMLTSCHWQQALHSVLLVCAPIQLVISAFLVGSEKTAKWQQCRCRRGTVFLTFCY